MSAIISDPCYPLPLRALPRREPVTVIEVLATCGIGGAQQHVLSLASRLDRRRFDARVVALSGGPAVGRLERAGVPVEVLDQPDDLATAALAHRFADLRPAIIHNHMYRAEVVGTSAALRTVAMGLPRPFIVSTVHSSRVRSAADRALLASLTPEMDRLVAVSHSIERKIAREGRRGVPVELIPNGVDNGIDPERYATDAPSRTLEMEFGLPAGAPLVGVIARLEPEKGHPTLLDAWPLVLHESPQARLLIVGEGSEREALEEQARRLGVLPRVIFTGARDDVPAVIGALDVAILPSYREAQGVSLLEAMALAKPIVASRVGGIPEFVEEGVTGLLVAPRDPAALAGAIVRVVRDDALADALGRNGRELVRERYCIDVMVRRVEDLYEEGIAAREVLAAVQLRSA